MGEAVAVSGNTCPEYPAFSRRPEPMIQRLAESLIQKRSWWVAGTLGGAARLPGPVHPALPAARSIGFPAPGQAHRSATPPVQGGADRIVIVLESDRHHRGRHRRAGHRPDRPGRETGPRRSPGGPSGKCGPSEVSGGTGTPLSAAFLPGPCTGGCRIPDQPRGNRARTALPGRTGRPFRPGRRDGGGPNRSAGGAGSRPAHSSARRGDTHVRIVDGYFAVARPKSLFSHGRAGTRAGGPGKRPRHGPRHRAGAGRRSPGSVPGCRRLRSCASSPWGGRSLMSRGSRSPWPMPSGYAWPRPSRCSSCSPSFFAARSPRSSSSGRCCTAWC